MIVKNTTSQNRSKQERLKSEHFVPTQVTSMPKVVSFLNYLLQLANEFPKEQVLYSIGYRLISDNSNEAVEQFLSEYDYDVIEIEEDIPEVFDLLGSAYQYLNTKLENLEKGSFYTPNVIAKDFVDDLDFNDGKTIFDPSCGSGAFLFNSNAKPEQIYGVDFDPTAVMIAKFNYFIKFPDAQYPNIFRADFFEWFLNNKDKRFDYIIGNPPYGANIDVSRIGSTCVETGESFSYFIEFSYRLLKEDGILRFLLPEALLNVKRHYDIRGFILDEANLSRIKRYSKKFAGVMSDVYMIELDRGNNEKVEFYYDETASIPKDLYRDLRNQIFIYVNDKDAQIIEEVRSRKGYDLKDSIFGLGVVTGDNKTKLFKEEIPGSEPIYTGKEIVKKYSFIEPKNYIIFDRSNLQQVAPDEIYRAPEKLVYKVINKNLKFVIDTTGALTTNSANIVIPKVRDLDIYTILALLNSDVMDFVHLKMFGGVNKVAKEHLMDLPLPSLSEAQNSTISTLAKNAISEENDIELQNYINYDVFGFDNETVEYIKSCVQPTRRSRR